MSHSYCKIWIHAIIGVKYKQALLMDEWRSNVIGHLGEQMKSLECYPRIINGTKDHLHVLYEQSPKIAVSDLFKQVKGESSHWINQQNLLICKFSWQVGYGAVSVGYSSLSNVYKYIENQKVHHQKISFQDELRIFLSQIGITADF